MTISELIDKAALTISNGGPHAILKLAEALNVTKNAVYAVKYGKRPCPARWCPIIERATNHAVLAEDFRPDIDWAVIRGYQIPRKKA